MDDTDTKAAFHSPSSSEVNLHSPGTSSLAHVIKIPLEMLASTARWHVLRFAFFV